MKPWSSRGGPLWLTALLTLSASAQVFDRLEYVRIEPPQPTSDSGRIVITEFFSYQCPHCFSFDPVLQAWANRLPGDVLFERESVSIGHAPWVAIARAWYALEALGLQDALHRAIFRAIHLSHHRLYDKEPIVDWLSQQGVDTSRFSQIYDSFSVVAAARRAEQRSLAHRVSSVPSLAIDGKFVVAIGDDGTVETFERQLASIDEVIDAIRAEKP